MKKIIEALNISKSFGNAKALDGISFSIKEGEIFGFLGPSGSGKTTTINILTGQLAPESGKSFILGKDSKKLNSNDLQEIGLISDSSGFYEKMTLYNNLLAYSKFYGVSLSYLDKLLKKVGLYDSRKTVAEKLSTGMKQRMLLVRALLNKPKILFLDEPTSGLDPKNSRSIHRLILDLKEQGTTIFLTTHDMIEATTLCDNLAFLDKGILIEQGNPYDLIQDYNRDKKVKISYNVGENSVISFQELSDLSNFEEILTVHSCEPTLEDIFIELTGGVLNV